MADDNPDRSYQFSYGSNEEDASREEVSDAKGEIEIEFFFHPKKIQLGKYDLCLAKFSNKKKYMNFEFFSLQNSDLYTMLSTIQRE